MTLLGLNPTSVAIKALAAALVAALLFGAGYYIAVRQYDTAAAQAVRTAAAAATKAQTAKDAQDYAADKADMQSRQAANAKAQVVYQTIYKDRAVLVPSPKDCVVPSAAMHALNDPALIGDTK